MNKHIWVVLFMLALPLTQAYTFQEIANSTGFILGEYVLTSPYYQFYENYTLPTNNSAIYQFKGGMVDCTNQPIYTIPTFNVSLPYVCQRNPIRTYIEVGNDHFTDKFYLYCWDYTASGWSIVPGYQWTDVGLGITYPHCDNSATNLTLNNSLYDVPVFVSFNWTTGAPCLVNRTNSGICDIEMIPALVETGVYWVPNYIALNISNKYETESFNIGVFVFDYYNDFLVFLNHNGTQYATTKSTGAYTGLSGSWYNVTINSNALPIGSSNATIFYNWSILLTNTSWINGSTLNYTLFSVNMTNCTVNASVRFLIYNEDIPTQKLTSNFSIELGYSYTILSKNFSGNYTDKDNYTFCIYPNTINLSVDAYAKYQNVTTYLNRYYMSNYLLSNITTNISVYLLPTSVSASDLVLTVRNLDTYNYFSDIYVQLQRNYLAEGIWRTVQMAKTNVYGKGYFKIKELNEDYRFIFTDADNNILDTSQSLTLLCSGGLCEITYLLNPNPVVSDRNTQIYHSFNNATGILTIFFVEASGDSIQFDSRVTRMTSLVNTQICAESSYGSFGSQTCNLSGLTGMFSIVASTSASPNITSYASILEILQPRGLGHNLGFAEQAIWGMAILLTFVGIGLFSPIAALLSGSVGLIIIYQLGMISGLTLGVLVAIFLLIAFIAYKVQE